MCIIQLIWICCPRDRWDVRNLFGRKLLGLVTRGRCSCAGFRHSAGFHARVVLDSDAFRPGVLGEVGDSLGVLGLDRVVPVFRCRGRRKSEWRRRFACGMKQVREQQRMRHVLTCWQTHFRRAKMTLQFFSLERSAWCAFRALWTGCLALYVQCLVGVLSTLQGHSGGTPTIPYKWKECIYRKKEGIFNPFWEVEKSERKREGQGPTISPSSTTKSFGERRKRRSFMSITQFLWKFCMAKWKNAGSMLAIVSSEVICNHDPGRNISCSKRWVFLKRLATPRPTPKVMLKRIWQKQQQQQLHQPISHTDVPSLWKQRTIWESNAESQDDSKHIIEADEAPGSRMQSTSQVEVDIHLGDGEVSTDGFSKNEAMKEELTDTNTKAIERIKIDSKKICFCEDQAKEKMLFRIQRRYFRDGWCGTHWSEEIHESMPIMVTILFEVGNSLPTNLDRIGRISFWNPQIAKLPYVFDYCKELQTRRQLVAGTSPPSKTHNRTFQKAKREYKKSQVVYEWSDGSTSPLQRHIDKGREPQMYFTCGVSMKISKLHLHTKM